MADDDDGAGKFGYKLVATAAAVVGGTLARKALSASWKTLTGKPPPSNPEHPAVTWAEAVSWAAVSGAVAGLARMVAQKRVASTWHRSTGKLPPGLEDTSA
jgi:hypothetical protein